MTDIASLSLLAIFSLATWALLVLCQRVQGGARWRRGIDHTLPAARTFQRPGFDDR